MEQALAVLQDRRHIARFAVLQFLGQVRNHADIIRQSEVLLHDTHITAVLGSQGVLTDSGSLLLKHIQRRSCFEQTSKSILIRSLDMIQFIPRNRHKGILVTIVIGFRLRLGNFINDNVLVFPHKCRNGITKVFPVFPSKTLLQDERILGTLGQILGQIGLPFFLVL